MALVSEVLQQHPRRLIVPAFWALQADDTLYTVLCLQPLGRIRISESGIGHADSEAAAGLMGDFFRLALELDAKPDLVVCPEYSVPWEVLLQMIEAGTRPARGKLWVLGCESLPLGQLDVYRQRLGERVIVIDEGDAGQAVTTQRYRNPLVYLFQSTLD